MPSSGNYVLRDGLRFYIFQKSLLNLTPIAKVKLIFATAEIHSKKFYDAITVGRANIRWILIYQWARNIDATVSQGSKDLMICILRMTIVI